MRVPWILLHFEDHHALTDADLGSREAGSVKRAHRLIHVGNQRAQLRAEVATWKRYTKAVAGVLEPA